MSVRCFVTVIMSIVDCNLSVDELLSVHFDAINNDDWWNQPAVVISCWGGPFSRCELKMGRYQEDDSFSLHAVYANSCVASEPSSVLWYCWLGLLTCKNRLPYNLYCVGGDVKHCTIQSNREPSSALDCHTSSSVHTTAPSSHLNECPHCILFCDDR